VQTTAPCFIQSATTGFTARVFPFHNRVSRKEAFAGPEPDAGKLSRPVLRGPAPSNGGWLLGGAPRIHGELLKLVIDIGEKSARSSHYRRSADCITATNDKQPENNPVRTRGVWSTAQPLCPDLSARSENLFTRGLLKPPTSRFSWRAARQCATRSFR